MYSILYLHLCSISLIEPGPVITEFERKVYEDGLKIDLSKADKVTADMFTNIYLKNYNQIFQSLGQTPEDVAEVLAQPRRLRTFPKRFMQHFIYFIHLSFQCSDVFVLSLNY